MEFLPLIPPLVRPSLSAGRIETHHPGPAAAPAGRLSERAGRRAALHPRGPAWEDRAAGEPAGSTHPGQEQRAGRGWRRGAAKSGDHPAAGATAAQLQHQGESRQAAPLEAMEMCPLGIFRYGG